MTAPLSLTKPHPARLTVVDFIRLDKAGAFREYSKSELIDGTIYVVNSQYSEHMKAKVRLLRRLADACDDLPGNLEAWSEGSVETAPDGLPEPDLFVTSRTPTVGAVPGETVVLIVEVADTTQSYDLGKKARHYAAVGIPEYWVVDLRAKRIHRLWAPQGREFLNRDAVQLGQRVASMTIPGLAIDTAGLA